MAVTQNTYTGNGATVLYSFTFPYLETTDVKVTINGTPTTAYTFANATTIQFNTAPANGAAIRIYRDTDDASLAATFYSGSAIRAQDLNDNFTQNLYVTQEVNNNSVNIDGSNPMVGPLNMNGFQIDNLATPTSDTDAVNRAYVNDIVANGIGDGDKGDIIVSGSGSTFTIDSGAITNSKVNASAGIVSSKLAFTQSGTGAVQRTVESKLQDVVSVKDFGVIGDGVTDNTTAYANLVAAVPAGSTIYWPPGTYVGTLYSTKALNLIGGPNVILKASDPINTAAIIRFEGGAGTYASLSAAPSWGDITLSGTTGLAAGDLVLLYSGSTRPGDGQPVNYEMVRMLTSTTVEGQVMSAQTGGTPQYSKITPIKDFTIEGFRFDLGTTAGTASNAVAAVWVRYSENVSVKNIHAVGGYSSTVRIDFCYDVHIENSSRVRPYDASSGYGYHIALNCNTNIHATEIRGVATRHTFDADSCYFLSLRNCLSQSGISSDIVITHNGFGGSHTYENVKVMNPEHNTYSIHTSIQGIASADKVNQVCRDIKIYNFRSIRRENPTNQAAAIYFQYSCQDINIQDVTIENPVNTSFTDQMAIRFAGPVFGKSSIIGCRISSYDWGIFISNDGVSNSAYPREADVLTIKDISCYRVKIPIYDDTYADQYLYLDVSNIDIENSAGYGFDCYMRITTAHQGITTLSLNSLANALVSSRNKIVKNTGGHYVVYRDGFSGLLAASLSPAGGILTQGQMLSASAPAGRILNAATITSVDPPAGQGQAVLFLCNGSVSISDAATVAGTITATSGETIKLISNGSIWRKIDTPGSW
jgi:hypothetical protein